jgi:phospholipid/cholesterol/gamma-HCH transport system ATP-binding protein
MIRIEELYKSFDGVEVLKGASIEVARGEVFALIGRSGCGKSVLLKHVPMLMRPDKGRILVDDQDVGSLRGRAISRLRDKMGFLFQGGALFDSMTLFENVAFPLREKVSLGAEKIKEKVSYELDQVGLLDAAGKYPSELSGGMVKRAAIARALVEEPEIMLFDEPTTGLDPLTGQTILDLIDSCHKRLKFTGIIVTHEIPKVFDIVDKVAMLHNGVVQFAGTPDEILSSPDPVVRRFITGGREEAGREFEA